MERTSISETELENKADEPNDKVQHEIIKQAHSRASLGLGPVPACE